MNSRWFVAWQKNQEGHLLSVFWMSPEQITLFQQYQDIVYQDNTYQTNILCFMLCTFVIIENTGYIQVCATVLWTVKTVEMFEWVL